MNGCLRFVIAFLLLSRLLCGDVYDVSLMCVLLFLLLHLSYCVDESSNESSVNIKPANCDFLLNYIVKMAADFMLEVDVLMWE